MVNLIYIMAYYYYGFEEQEEILLIICKVSTFLSLISIMKYSHEKRYLFKGALCGIILTIAIYIGLMLYMQTHIEYVGGIVVGFAIIMSLVHKSLKGFLLSLAICGYTHLLSLLASLYFDGYAFLFGFVLGKDLDNKAIGMVILVILDIHLKVIICFIIIALILTIKQILNKKTE